MTLWTAGLLLMAAYAEAAVWSDRTPRQLQGLRGLRELAEKHPLLRQPLVTTRTYIAEADLSGIIVEFSPVALHCYTIARNLLRSKH